MERLHLEIGFSWLYCLLCAAVHGLAALVLSISNLDGLLILSLGMALVVSLVFHIRRDGLRRDPASVTALAWRDGIWRLRLADGSWHRADPAASVVLLRHLVVINLRDDTGRRRSLAVLPDAVDSIDFRRLKVLLRVYRRASQIR